MKFVTDLHVHSHYSRSTSKNLNLEFLYAWAQLKGIDVVGTGDFTHPGWMAELQDKLEPCPKSDGLFRLKPEYHDVAESMVPASCRMDVRFMLTVEISSIYKRLDKVRKVHNCVFVPSFDTALTINNVLSGIGNLKSDGRPILGLDSRDLLEIVLNSDPLSYLIPAHIWTPWFSALGSKSGFDSITDCFADLTDHVFALETGLSSDPVMNWRLSQLDRFVLVSNGDAHSPQKLGREATVFDTETSFASIRSALANPGHEGLLGTIEFFPEEGKYHFDGCRNCGVRMHPRQSVQHNGLCPECGRKATIGVMARVEELADHPEGRKSPNWRPYFSLIPLAELIADAKSMGVQSKTVQNEYFRILSELGNELYILQDCPIERMARKGGSLIAEGVQRMRDGKIDIQAGYDGEYGTINVFSEEDRSQQGSQQQMLLFS
jgi:DNA helicase-2/ATP-dependent DNA helicase PcrA